MLDQNKTIFNEISDTYPNMDNTAIRNALAAFLFTGDDVFKLISELSGGERGRVSLAKLMLSEANFLILDEPTNHLDITSKEILEHALNNYTGTILYVSHDRYFINRTATRILDLAGKKLLIYLGNYDYYLEKKPEMEYQMLGRIQGSRQVDAADTITSGNARNLLSGLRINHPSSDSPDDSPSQIPEAVSEIKLDWKQQKEEQARQRKKQSDLKKVEDEIHRLESRQSEIDELLLKDEIFSNPDKLLELGEEKNEIDQQLMQLMEQWEMLAEE